ncbi:hypothetical protein CLF_100738 [Clonorchis sinensis]|uniref:Uncharacterized protein n=1 Tax=Clonorchis sinensis TaxID=79923 RepID=G7Y449_CLOSI|nr:hypothetical protein CLF_100738 [Clonorchis sinensis]
MTSLRLLDLRKTGLTELPDSLQHLINLEILRLDGNPLHTPPLCVASRGLAHVMAFLVLHSLGYRRNSSGRQPSERKMCCGLCETEDVGFKNPVRSAAESEFSSLDRRSYTSPPGLIAVEKYSLPRLDTLRYLITMQTVTNDEYVPTLSTTDDMTSSDLEQLMKNLRILLGDRIPLWNMKPRAVRRQYYCYGF